MCIVSQEIPTCILHIQSRTVVPYHRLDQSHKTTLWSQKISCYFRICLHCFVALWFHYKTCWDTRQRQHLHLFLSTFQCIQAHSPHHVVPHDQTEVWVSLLHRLAYFGDVTQEELVHTAVWSTQPLPGLVPLAQQIDLVGFTLGLPFLWWLSKSGQSLYIQMAFTRIIPKVW